MKNGTKRLIALAGCVCFFLISDPAHAGRYGYGGGGMGPGGGGGGMGPGPGGGGGGGTTATYDNTFTSLHFSGSGNCAMCHNNIYDENGTDVSLETSWSSTVMAHASRDPFWRAKVSSEIARAPHLADIINDKCSRCHAPMANTEAAYYGDAPSILTDLQNPANIYYDAATDSVSCTLCHQITDSADLGTNAGFSGHYEIDTFASSVDRLIYGPYTDVFTGPMRNMVSYTITYSPHIKDSEICATCHNLRTPYVDAGGEIVSTPETEFPEQMVYSEWLASDYVDVQSCQDCHMTRTDGVIMANRPMWLSTQRNDFATHGFVGANLLLLDILQNNQAELGATVNNISQTIQKTEEMLQSAAAINLVDSSLNSGTLDFGLEVESFTGHKLPSGIPVRRLILHVTVTDARGRTVFESGRVNGDGSVTGVDSDINQAAFEPHYELITSEDQVQVYEAVMQNYEGGVTYTLLRSADMLKDNRLLPAGFDKQTVPAEIGVRGAAGADRDFTGGSDVIRYRISGLKGSRFTIRAELVYQTVSYAFLQDLNRDATPEIASVSAMYQASPVKASQVTESTFVVR